MSSNDKSADSVPTDKSKKRYDVFISHSHVDKDIVENQLRKRLEEEYKLKCCNVTKDFEAGKTITQNILSCLKRSRKALLVISKAFLESTWTQFEVGEVICKEGRSKKLICIPILLEDVKIDDPDNGLPAYIRRQNMLQWGETDFWDKLINAMKAEDISALVPAGNISNGLAWSYYYGYLALVLPGLRKRVADKELTFPEEKNGEVLTYKTADDIKHLPFLAKMMIVLPNSGFCPPNLKFDDENVQHVCHIPKTASRAGNLNRDYKSSVYLVKHPDGREVLIIAEFATPLMSMYEMEIGTVAGLSKEEKHHQIKLFEEKMQEILSHENNQTCHQTYCFLAMDDPRNEKTKKPVGWSLSERLAKKAFEELDLEEKVEQEKQNMKKAGISDNLEQLEIK